MLPVSLKILCVYSLVAIGFIKYFKPYTSLSRGGVLESEARRSRTINYLTNITANLPKSPNDLPSPVTLFRSIDSLICLITKNGNSVLRYGSCLLSIAEKGNITAFDLFNLQETHRGAFTEQCNRLLLTARWDFTKVYKKVAFIRDPLERFISGYLFVCKRDGACFDCGNDFPCFLTTLYHCWTTQRRYSSICDYHHSSPQADLNSNHHNSSSYLYWHVMPQAAFCHLWKQHRQYKLIKYSQETIKKFLMNAARSVLDEIRLANFEERLRRKTEHSAIQVDVETLKKVIVSNKNLTNMFAQLFFIDYKIFSLEIPKFISDFELYDS